jgi:zinc protease
VTSFREPQGRPEPSRGARPEAGREGPTTTSGLSPVRRLLSNGAAVTLQHTSFSPAVTISAMIRAGSLYEPDALPGLAWLCGRVIDRGTANRSAGSIADVLDDHGVTLRISANRHVLTMTCTCLSEDFPEILALVADVARTPVFPQDQIDKRRAETVTAIRQDQDNPAIRATEALQALLYGVDHPYGRPAKGTAEAIERITRDDLCAHHAQRFAPGALSLAVVGDFDPTEGLDRIEEAFGDWDVPLPPDREVPPVPAVTGRRRVDISMPGKSQTDIAYGFISINRLHPDYYSHWVMNNILGQFGLGGRLAENIRERQGMAYYAFSMFDPSLGPGPLLIRAGVDPRNVERAIGAIDAEVGELGTDGPTDRELLETRQFLIGSIPRMLETNQSIATFLQTSEFFGLGLDYDQRLPELLESVTIEDVRRAAASVLRPERAAVAVAGPTSSGSD